jgi:hypothetical protein
MIGLSKGGYGLAVVYLNNSVDCDDGSNDGDAVGLVLRRQ